MIWSRAGTYRSWTGRPKDASSKGRVVQGTRRPRDASSKGRVVQRTRRPRDAWSKGRGVQERGVQERGVQERGVQETRRPRYALSKGRIVQGMHCSTDGTSETFRLVIHRSGTLYHVILQMIVKNHYVKNFSTVCLPKESFKKVCLSKCCSPEEISMLMFTTVDFLTSAKHLRMNNHYSCFDLNITIYNCFISYTHT